MNDIGEGHHEDIVRAFFRFKVAEIAVLLPYVVDIIRKSAHELGRDLSVSLPEANRVVLVVLRAALEYRDYNLGVYGIDLPMLRPWTSKMTIIDIVLNLFDTTTKLAESSSADNEAVWMSSELNMQLPELASILFSCIYERLEWLRRYVFVNMNGLMVLMLKISVVAANDSGTERERKELGERFTQMRPEVLETLRECFLVFGTCMSHVTA